MRAFLTYVLHAQRKAKVTKKTKEKKKKKKKKKVGPDTPGSMLVSAGKKTLPIPTAAQVAAVANTAAETPQQVTDRELLEDQKRLQQELKDAVTRGLCPLVDPAMKAEDDFSLPITADCGDFSLGGSGATLLGLNPQRPMCKVQLYAALDTTRSHSSSKAGSWRKWQVVFLKDPAAWLPARAQLAASTRFVVWWVAQCFDEHGMHLGEPIIYLVPWCRITTTVQKCKPFVLAVGPQDCESQEKHVLPCRKRCTNLNGYWSGIFGTYFDIQRLELVKKFFPLIAAPLPTAATASFAAAAPSPLTSMAAPPVPRCKKITESETSRRMSGRVKARHSMAELAKIEGWDALLLRAEEAESYVTELKAQIVVLKRKPSSAAKAAEKEKKTTTKRKVPQYMSRAKLEEGLEENYGRTKTK